MDLPRELYQMYARKRTYLSTLMEDAEAVDIAPVGTMCVRCIGKYIIAIRIGVMSPQAENMRLQEHHTRRPRYTRI